MICAQGYTLALAITITQTGGMYVQLKFPMDTPSDAAWRALRSVAVVRELYSPLVDVRPLGDFIPENGSASVELENLEAVATMWEPGSVECRARLFGIIPLGRQIIRVSFEQAEDGRTNLFVDTGGATSGPLALLTGWRHRMAVSPLPGDPGRSLWRDRVEFHGPMAPLYWPVLWALWQWRGQKIRALAPGWAQRANEAG